MPISSGASGRPARSHLPAGVQPVNKRNDPDRQVGITRSISRRSSASDHAIHQDENRRRVSKTSIDKVSGTRVKSKQMPAHSSSDLRNLNIASEKYKRISHISAPSSNSTTSLLANKYFESEANLTRQSESDKSVNNNTNNNNNQRERRNSLSEHTNQLCEDAQCGRANSNQTLANERPVADGNDSASSKSPGLFGSLMLLGASQKTQNQRRKGDQRRIQTKATTTMKRGSTGQGGRPSLNDAHYSTAITTNETLGRGSINPSMSPAFHIGGKKVAGANLSSNRTPTSSASGSTANLHSLSSLHQQPTTTINRGFNLKYVKTLIIVLMSLDFLITIFVHNFASHDEFLIAFTRSKLRLSLVNLIASAVWFVVLSGAILFDVYFVLVVACLVDLASFTILLACSVYHFTHRIDYNLVSMTSLLLLLFSIIILHVYLLALTALTIYLTLAVKRRRKH